MNTVEKSPSQTMTTAIEISLKRIITAPMPTIKTIDIIARGPGQKDWTEWKLSLQDLITQTESNEALIAFLPGISTLVGLRVESKLTNTFQIPPSFWKSIAQEASGFFGSRGISAGRSRAATSSIFYRFLIKEPVHAIKTFSKSKDLHPEYVWHKLGFFLSWTPQGKTRVLCFDTPKLLQDAITTSVKRITLGPDTYRHLILNNILVEEIVALFDRSVWLWREVVRGHEKNRPSTGIEPPDPDYIKLHEVARHIIHSSETLAIAQETLKSMTECYSTILRGSETDILSSDIQAELQQQDSLLKCVHLRSQAVEARLRNEINLAFNLVAQYDARSAIQISTNTAIDSAAMKTISVLGLVFLPGTFICSIFSTTFFNFNPGDGTTPQAWVVSNKFWVYFAVAVPVTLLTIAFWFAWNHASTRAAQQNKALERRPTIYSKAPRAAMIF